MTNKEPSKSMQRFRVTIAEPVSAKRLKDAAKKISDFFADPQAQLVVEQTKCCATIHSHSLCRSLRKNCAPDCLTTSKASTLAGWYRSLSR